MSQKVLITGASGLIGTRLTEMLLQKGYQVVHLGRAPRQKPVPCFAWDIDAGTLDMRAFEGVQSIIHLAGAGIADARWTPARKKEILTSRTQSTKLLFNALNTAKHEVKNFISASAIGYYGFSNQAEPLKENSNPGCDFLASVVKAWESEINSIERLAIRVAVIRIGIVLSADGGALKEMAKPIRWGVGAPLGTGNQWMSWIHLEDLCRLFCFALERDSTAGTYNAVAPYPVTNRMLTRAIAHQLKKPLWLPAVPGFVLRIMLGEMADMVLQGSIVSSLKIESEGFEFKFPKLEMALADLLATPEK